MASIDEQIAQALADAQRSGELQSAPSWGKPLDLDDGFARTPDELRMAFKALKEAGFVPPEVETMRRIAALRQVIDADPCAPEAEAMRKRLSDLRQHLALRLEKLRVSRSL
ncbi:MAG: DUF1992 domain-containing protein [Burkholderiaceae bacterium]